MPIMIRFKLSLWLKLFIFITVGNGLSPEDDWAKDSVLVHPEDQDDPIDLIDLMPDIKMPLSSQMTDRNGVRNKGNNRWKDCVLPYSQSQWRPLSSAGVDAVKKAFADYHDYTCVRIELWSRSKHGNSYVEFQKDQGCYSYVGKIGGKQAISIGDGCEFKGVVIHEMMHTLGFYHEQSRRDRDSHVKIYFNNVISKYKDQFDKIRNGDEENFGTKYDYKSVMHYRKKAFTKDGKDTIVAFVNGLEDCRKENPAMTAEIGQRRGFSSVDLDKINAMCGCPGYHRRNTTSSSSTTTTSVTSTTSTSATTTTTTASTSTTSTSSTTATTTTTSATTTTSTSATTATTTSATTTTIITTSTTVTTTTSASTTTTTSKRICVEDRKNWWACRSAKKKCDYDRTVRRTCPKTCNSCDDILDEPQQDAEKTTTTTTTSLTSTTTAAPTTTEASNQGSNSGSDPSCQDNPRYNCAKKKHLCTHSWWGTNTKKQCPVTCNVPC